MSAVSIDRVRFADKLFMYLNAFLFNTKEEKYLCCVIIPKK